MTEKIITINAEKEHRKLWEWLAKTGYSEKYRYKRIDTLPQIISSCFACINDGLSGDCMKHKGSCPISWGNTTFHRHTCPCESTNSPYKKWIHCPIATDRKKYAKKISELPWNGPKIFHYDPEEGWVQGYYKKK